MPNLTDIVSTKLFPYRLYIVGVVVLIIFIIVSAIVYNKYMKGVTKFGDVANADMRTKEADIMLFTVDWCPHCKQAAQPWKDFCDKNDKKIVNGYLINCASVDCTDPDNADVHESIQKYEIEHYPTVKLIVNGNVTDFDAKISVESLESFLKTILV